MELAKRFRGMLADLGLRPAQAAKLLHVSLRTVHNWNSGTHQIPVMAYKLLRMMRYMELPGKSWQGWHFSRGMLITPEGRQICGHDGAWWSLLVRRAAGFTELYQRANAAHLASSDRVQASGLAAAGSVPDAGLVSVSTTHTAPQNTWGQDGAIMEPWPTISDFPPLSMPMPENDANASESALTPCFALPSMPTFGTQSSPSTPVYRHNPEHPKVSQSLQSDKQSSTPAVPGLRLTPLPVRLHLVQLASCQSSPSLNAGKLPGSSAKPENSEAAPVGQVAA